MKTSTPMKEWSISPFQRREKEREAIGNMIGLMNLVGNLWNCCCLTEKLQSMELWDLLIVRTISSIERKLLSNEKFHRNQNLYYHGKKYTTLIKLDNRVKMGSKTVNMNFHNNLIKHTTHAKRQNSLILSALRVRKLGNKNHNSFIQWGTNQFQTN